MAADTRLYRSKRSAVINRRVAIRSIGCRCNMLRSVKPCAVALREATPSAASQSLAGARGQITQVPGPEFYPLEWTPYGLRSNLEGGLVPGGRSTCPGAESLRNRSFAEHRPLVDG